MNKKTFIFLFFISVLFSKVFAYEILDRNSINVFDRTIVRPYSSSLDKAGTFMTAGLLASPSLLILIPTIKNEYDWNNGGIKGAATLAFVYAQSIVCTYAAKEALKTVIDRKRPYMYFTGAPEGEISSGEFKDSFPSGHTSLAFCSASFLTVSYCRLFPHSRCKVAVGACSFAAASVVAASRVMAGCHFTTDVLAGAAIGTFFGAIFPMLEIKQKNVGFAFTGNGVNLKIDL